MRAVILALLVIPALVLCAGCANGVKMTDEEAAACRASGCTAWTEAELETLIRHFYGRGFKAGAQSEGRAL